MKLLRVPGITGEIWQVFIRDTTKADGSGLTGLTNTTVGLSCYYHRDTDTTATIVALASMTVGTYTAGGFAEVDAINMPGWYQFCPPNAALAVGAKSCGFHLKGATNMSAMPIEVDLDPQVDVRLWQSSSPNALAAGRVDAVTNIRSATCQAGSIASNIVLDAAASGVNDIYKWALIFLTGGTGAGQCRTINGYTGSTKTATIFPNWTIIPDATTTFTLIPFNEVDLGGWLGNSVNPLLNGKVDAITAATSGICQSGSTSNTIVLALGAVAVDGFYTDDLVYIHFGTGVGQTRQIRNYVGATRIATISPLWYAVPDTTSQYTVIPNARSDEVRAGVAQSGTNSSIQLDVGAGGLNNLYNGMLVRIVAGTGVGQCRVITNYNVNTKQALVDRDWVTAPDNTSIYELIYANSPALTDNLNVTSAADSVVIHKGTAQGGTGTSITLDTGASSTDNIYNGNLISITSGTGAGQSRTIIAYNGATKVASVDKAWSVVPDLTSMFSIFANTTATTFSDQGVAQAGTANTITLASTASTTNNVYNSSFVTILSGTGAGQTKEIISYVGATRVATVDSPWSIVPDPSSVYAVIPSGNAVTTQAAPTVGQIAAAILANPANLLYTNTNGRVDVGNIQGQLAQLDVNNFLKVDVEDMLGKPAVIQNYPTNFASLAIDAAGRIDVGRILGVVSVGAPGFVGVDWSHINAPTTTVDLSGTTVKGLDTPPPSGTMVLDLTQPVPVNGSAPNSVGDCLNAARAQGFGTWSLDSVRKTITLYAPDKTTVVRIFDLDSVVSPAVRTER